MANTTITLTIISTHSLTKRLTVRELTLDNTLTISTHSLTKRLTVRELTLDNTLTISTHSLTKRLTILMIW